MIEELDDDKAVEKYVSTGDETLKTILRKVLQPIEREFGPFENSSDYIVDFDSEDALIDTTVPGASFNIEIDEPRLQVVAKILEQTYCAIRVGYEEPSSNGRYTLHIFKPKTHGVLDYTYSLAEGDHNFWAKTNVKSIVVPNYIQVMSPIDAETEYSGYAKDSEAYNKYPKRRIVRISGVDSNAAATNIAEAILSKIQANRETAAGRLPMNCGQELYDYVGVTDIRDGNEILGNIGSLHRIWDAQERNPNVYPMMFTFGGGMDVEKVIKLPHYSDIDLLKAEFKAPTWHVSGDAVAETHGSVLWLPFDVTWTLIGATVPEGSEPTGANLIVDILVDGVSVHTDSSLCEIVIGQSSGFVAPTGDDVVIIPAYSLITMEVTQIGSTLPGTDLTVEFWTRFDKA